MYECVACQVVLGGGCGDADADVDLDDSPPGPARMLGGTAGVPPAYGVVDTNSDSSVDLEYAALLQQNFGFVVRSTVDHVLKARARCES